MFRLRLARAIASVRLAAVEAICARFEVDLACGHVGLASERTPESVFT